MSHIKFIPPSANVGTAVKAGFRVGDKGTHSSRTMMLSEITQVLAATSPQAKREDYVAAIVEYNCLGKPTASTRRLSSQRLSELYGLDPTIQIFRVFRNLWYQQAPGRPLLALLCALARDPLLISTAEAIVQQPPESEFLREPMRASIRETVGERLNENVLEKVVRNAASTWTQTGHFQGRSLKVRRQVQPTPSCVAYALYLAYLLGFRGPDLFSSGWVAVLDCLPAQARSLALDAKRLGLIDIRTAGDVMEISFNRLEHSA